MTFIRNPDDNQPLQRLNDEICLAVSRLGYVFDRVDTGTDWRKNGDAIAYRRWDNDRVDRFPDIPVRRPSDNPIADRLPAEDYFRRL